MAQKKPSLKDMQVDLAKQQMPFFMPLLQWAAQNAGLPGLGSAPSPMAPQPQAPMPPPTNAGSAGRFQGTATSRGFSARPTMGPQAQLAAMPPQAPPMASTQPVGGAPPMGPPPQAGVLSGQALGVYGQNPADVFRLQQAEEDVNRMAGQRARLLQYRLGQQGIGGSGAAASALAQNERGALSDLSNFRRQLAIGAGQEQERRLQLLMQMLGMGAQQGAQGQNVYAQQQQISASKPGLFGQLAPLASMFTLR